MNYDALKLENQLCFPLYSVANKVIRLYKPLLEPLGLTYTQYLVMMVLWANTQKTVKEIGKLLHLDSGTLTPVLKRMEKNGFLTRTRSKEDERAVIIHITEKGAALKEQAVSVPEKLGSCIPLSKDEAMELYKLLYKVID